MNLAGQARIWSEAGEEKEQIRSDNFVKRQWPHIVDAIASAADLGERDCFPFKDGEYAKRWNSRDIETLCAKLDEQGFEYTYNQGVLHITWWRAVE